MTQKNYRTQGVPRPATERSAVDRVQNTYGDKYDLLMVHDSKQDVANLLHEEAETRSIRERLRQKQQQQAQQMQNKKKVEHLVFIKNQWRCILNDALPLFSSHKRCF
ncbi:MAG: hypothetical protein V8S92_09825 [Oscillospiraceae bacterium]